MRRLVSWRWALLVAVGLLLTLGCEPSVMIANKSGRNTSVYVTTPEGSGPQLLHIPAGGSDSAVLGQSGIYSVSVLPDQTVLDALKKTRDDLEQQLRSGGPADAARLQEQVQAITKLYNSQLQRAASCGGKLQGGSDVYATIDWDPAASRFTVACFDKSVD